MPPKKRKTQTRLPFKPADASSSPAASTSSALKPGLSRIGISIPICRSPSTAKQPSSSSSAQPASRTKSKAMTQVVNHPISPSPATFMSSSRRKGKCVVIHVSSEESAAEIGDAGFDEDAVDLLPPTHIPRDKSTSDAPNPPGSSDPEEGPSTGIPRSSQSVSTRLQKATIIDDDSDEEEPAPLVRASSPRKRSRQFGFVLDDSDDASSRPQPSTSQPLKPTRQTPKPTRQAPKSTSQPPKPTLIVLDDSEDEDVVATPAKKRKVTHQPSSSATVSRTPGRLKRPNPKLPPAKKAHKGHRTEKQKTMELLRRRRAGEKITQLTSSESSSDDDRRGIYDSDSEGQFEVLTKFDDEERDESAAQRPAPRKNKGKLKKAESQSSDLDDFITDDDDVPLGAPVDIPLEFTSNAHKPLKEQFPFVVEWLVHNRINPAFERRDPVYVNAWRKLDDEFHGLASSKFISSAWKADFSRALRSRPHLESFELTHIDPEQSAKCEACGRSGHTPTSKIVFSGSAYHKDTLAEVESESDSEDSDDSDDASIDTQGMPLPPTAKEWYVGRVCCDNATLAHTLLHWKFSLKEWVEDRLENEGWMAPQKLRDREKMKAKRRRELANGIVDAWLQKKIVATLYGNFKNQLEIARNQDTSGRVARGRYK